MLQFLITSFMIHKLYSPITNYYFQQKIIPESSRDKNVQYYSKLNLTFWFQCFSFFQIKNLKEVERRAENKGNNLQNCLKFSKTYSFLSNSKISKSFISYQKNIFNLQYQFRLAGTLLQLDSIQNHYTLCRSYSYLRFIKVNNNNDLQYQSMEVYRLNLSVISQLPIYISSKPKPSKKQKNLSFCDKKQDQESFRCNYHNLSKLDLKKKKSRQKQEDGAQFKTRPIYNDFLTQRARRSTKVFYRLSKILKKRTPDQCKSHHQKLQIKSQDGLEGIMHQVWKKIQKTIAQDFVNEHHHLYSPSFLFFKQSMKPQSQELQNEWSFDEKRKKRSSMDWYNFKIIDNNIKIQIKQEAVENWNHL